MFSTLETIQFDLLLLDEGYYADLPWEKRPLYTSNDNHLAIMLSHNSRWWKHGYEMFQDAHIEFLIPQNAPTALLSKAAFSLSFKLRLKCKLVACLPTQHSGFLLRSHSDKAFQYLNWITMAFCFVRDYNLCQHTFNVRSVLTQSLNFDSTYLRQWVYHGKKRLVQLIFY